MKIFSWISQHSMLLLTLFLFAFIPLYPKIPLIGITHTWVYIRFDDVFIAAAVAIFFIQLVRRKVSINTPLTVPIFFFWIVGAISTLYAVLFIFPTLINVFPKIALFHYVRRIEYLAIFFVAFAAIKNKKDIKVVIAVLTVTLLAVVLYGMGQRFLGFPAFLTMNEEFAKGIPLRLSAAARIPSTFAGHYDLAAYLVMLIPIMGSLIFGFRNIFVKLILFVSAGAGLILLLMTASRTSFLVYLVTIAFMLLLQKKKWLIIPVFIVSMLLLQEFQGLYQRFGSTISTADVVYDARTGKAVGIAKKDESTGNKEDKKIVIEEVPSTGESLPQGSSYINIPNNQPTTKAPVTRITYKRTQLKNGTSSTEITNVEGDFIVKKALAYDVSFTTRFQGEWPRAFEAFKRNILFGSGYSSISLATDGNYLRILGEVGLLGLISFFSIFVFIGIYAYKILPDVDSPVAKSFVLGVLAALMGLGLNAVLIDVFEASKVAYMLWLLVGVTLGLLHLYQKKAIDFKKEVIAVVVSPVAIGVYLLVASFVVFGQSLNNFFIGDDFTWLRWIADCQKITTDIGITCVSSKTTIINFFTQSQGFFYRPGTKLYFFFMYAIAWFTPLIYHIFSVFAHFVVTFLVFLISSKVLKNKLFAGIVAVLFLVLSSHFESIFWIAATGHIIAAGLMLFALLFYMYWKENNRWILLVLSILSAFAATLFHEFGVFSFVLIIGFDLIMYPAKVKALVARWYYLLFVIQVPVYWLLRNLSGSLWFQGDYSYNLLKFPINALGNVVGYIGVSFIGSRFMPYYDLLRNLGKENLLLSMVGGTLILVGCVYAVLSWRKKLSWETIQVVGVGLVIFITSLIPFLGLGNITIRYSYLGSFGLLLILAYVLQHYVMKAGNKVLAYGLVMIFVLSFVSFHVSELYRINKDWTNAGKITNNLLVKLAQNYKSSKQRILPENPVFYFVNLPIRLGDAWVFPVGLEDAVWFDFQNELVTVKTAKTLDDAFLDAKAFPGAKVFEFDKHGNIEEVIQATEIIP